MFSPQEYKQAIMQSLCYIWNHESSNCVIVIMQLLFLFNIDKAMRKPRNEFHSIYDAWPGSLLDS